MEVKRCFGRIISTILRGMVLFILSDCKKRGRKPSRAALVFSHAGKKGEQMNIYVIYEFLNEKWHERNIFNNYAKAADFVHKAREWEKRWKEQGFEYAPAPGIYKIVRFTEAETFTIED